MLIALLLISSALTTEKLLKWRLGISLKINETMVGLSETALLVHFTYILYALFSLSWAYFDQSEIQHRVLERSRKC